MRIRLTLYLGALCLASQGCSPIGHAIRTSVIQPALYPRCMNEIVECCRDYLWARDAWKEFQEAHPETPYSSDFACGFKEGYTDYLYAGGTGCPPPVPPRCYWNSCYENPEGHQAIANWFAGFRVGAEWARRSGYRELVVLPSSQSAAPPLPPGPLPPPPPGGLPVPGPHHEEELPVPRKEPLSPGARAPVPAPVPQQVVPAWTPVPPQVVPAWTPSAPVPPGSPLPVPVSGSVPGVGSHPDAGLAVPRKESGASGALAPVPSPLPPRATPPGGETPAVPLQGCAPSHPVTEVLPAAPSLSPVLAQGLPALEDPEQLVALLRGSMLPSQREWAAYCLAGRDWHAQPRVVVALLIAAEEDPAPAVRACCRRTLAGAEGPSQHALLAEPLQTGIALAGQVGVPTRP
jgi:hypothetical protein